MEGQLYNKAESLIQCRIWWHKDKFKKITKFKISLISFFCPKLNIVHLCWWGLSLKTACTTIVCDTVSFLLYPDRENSEEQRVLGWDCGPVTIPTWQAHGTLAQLQMCLPQFTCNSVFTHLKSVFIPVSFCTFTLSDLEDHLVVGVFFFNGSYSIK